MKAKEVIEEKRRLLVRGVNQPVSAPDVYDELGKLAALHDKGVVNDDEFAAKKKQLLGL